MNDDDSGVSVEPEDRTDSAAELEPEENLAEVFVRLVDTARDYAEAELDRQKFRAIVVASGLRTVGILGVVALILMFGTLVTLMLGLVLALAPLLSPLGATAAVAAAGLVIVAVLLIVARNRVRALFRNPVE
ncbi:hypothetical protein BH10PSE14_BH10PSE14_17690 [soil metagenome]